MSGSGPRLREIDLRTAGDAELQPVLDLERACLAVDRPLTAPPTDAERLEWLRRTRPARRRLVAAEVLGTSGEPVVVGEGVVQLTGEHDLDRSYVSVRVHPDHRRRGLGTALAGAVRDIAVSEGRTELVTEVIGPAGAPLPGVGLATSLGMHRSHGETARRLALPVPASVLGPLRPSPPDRIETSVGGVPREYAPGLVRLIALVEVDAPTGDLDVEPEPYTVDDYRRDHERCAQLGQLSLESIAVSGAGEVCAVSQVLLGPATPDTAVQLATYVDRAHRGRRLGLATKIANLDWLAAHAPDRRWVRTWNSDDNEPVLRLNRALGFEPIESMSVMVVRRRS